jgi:hypothetical protein
MRSLAVRSASSRRTIVAVLFAGLAFTAVRVQAQDAPAAAPAQAPAPAADPFKFTTDAALMIFYVKPDQTAAFENVWGSIRGKLAASEKPELKALGDSLKVYRAPGEPTPQGYTYFFVADPASKQLSYSPSPFLLFEAGLFEDAQARALFDQLNGALNGINPLPLNRAAPAIAPAAAAPAAPAAAPAP